jgi:hypothetical protein
LVIALLLTFSVRASSPECIEPEWSAVGPKAEKFDAGRPVGAYHRLRTGGSHEEARMIVYTSLLSRFRGRTAEGFA